MSDWHGDGIISRATTPKLFDAIAKTGVPLIELTDRHGNVGLPHVRSDDAGIGQMAAEHLIGQLRLRLISNPNRRSEPDGTTYEKSLAYKHLPGIVKCIASKRAVSSQARVASELGSRIRIHSPAFRPCDVCSVCEDSAVGIIEVQISVEK